MKKESLLIVLFSGLLFGDFFAQNFYGEGMKEYYNKNDMKSVELFTKAIDNNQEVSKAYMMRAAAKTMLKQYNAAFTDIKKSIEIDPENYKAYFYYGRIYFLQGFYNSAIKYYDISISKYNHDPDVFDDRAMCKVFNEDFKGAIADEDQAIKLDSTVESFFLTRGYAKLELKQYKSAIEDFNKSINISPSQKAFADRGLAYYHTTDYKKAIEDFTKSLSIISEDKEVLYYRGMAFAKTGQMELACRDFTISGKLGYSLALKEEKSTCGFVDKGK